MKTVAKWLQIELRLLLFLMVCCVAGLLFFVVKKTRIFLPKDIEPGIEYLLPSHVKKDANIVNVGIDITEFPNFDTIKNNFVISGVVWFKFDPSCVSIDIINKFSFKHAEILSKDEPFVKVDGTSLIASYKVKVKFSSLMNYALFPFDDHIIRLILENKYLSTNDVIYHSENKDLSLSKMIKILGWKYSGHKVVWGYEKDTKIKKDDVFGGYPEVVFSMNFKRFGFNSIFTLILPLILMFFIGLFGFSLLSSIGSMGFVVSSILSSIAGLFMYRFIIDGIKPKTGELIFVDYIYIFVLICVFIELILTIFFHKFAKAIFFIKMRILISSLFQFSLVFIFYYLLFVWQEGM